MREEHFPNVPDDQVKTKADDAVQDGAVKFEATNNNDGTWDVTTTFDD